jgi:predicted dehydrogenase
MDGIDKTYFLEWQEFMDAIREGRSPMVTGEDGLRVIEVIEAARVSAELGIQTKVIREPIRPMDSE